MLARLFLARGIIFASWPEQGLAFPVVTGMASESWARAGQLQRTVGRWAKAISLRPVSPRITWARGKWRRTWRALGGMGSHSGNLLCDRYRDLASVHRGEVDLSDPADLHLRRHGRLRPIRVLRDDMGLVAS